MTQKTIRRNVKASHRVGGETLVMGKASGKDTTETPRRDSGVHAESLADMVETKKVSVDPRHTGPRKKRGGWPAMPPSKSFTLWVPNSHYEKLSKLSHEKKQSVGALVRHAIAEMIGDGQGSPQVSRSGAVPDAASSRFVRALRKGDPAPVSR